VVSLKADMLMGINAGGVLRDGIYKRGHDRNIPNIKLTLSTPNCVTGPPDITVLDSSPTQVGYRKTFDLVLPIHIDEHIFTRAAELGPLDIVIHKISDWPDFTAQDQS